MFKCTIPISIKTYYMKGKKDNTGDRKRQKNIKDRTQTWKYRHDKCPCSTSHTPPTYVYNQLTILGT